MGVSMRSLLVSSACAASLMLALTPAASAADVDYAPEPAGPSWYVSVFGGWSLPDDIDLDFETAPVSGTAVDFSADVDLDNGFLAGVAVGAHFADWLRGEVEVSGHWHDAGGEAQLAIGAGSTTYDVDGDAHALFVLANLWLELPIDEAIRPYVGGGIGIGRLDLELEGTTPSATVGIVDDSSWGFAFQLGAGVAFDITDNLAVDVGYRFKRIHDAEFELDADVTNDPLEAAEADVDYTSHNVLLGLRIGF
jgi:opacity protein-like surface antigen